MSGLEFNTEVNHRIKEVTFLGRVLCKPSYGYERNGEVYVPTRREVLKEAFANVNIFKSRKNWPGFLTLSGNLYLLWNVYVYFTYFLNWKELLIAYFYMFHFYTVIYEGIYHRAINHHAVKFKNEFWKFITRNLVLKDLPHEVHQIAHHVHHRYSDRIGDPYNARMGALCLWFSDINHQKISTELSRTDYEKVSHLLSDLIYFRNTYEQYKKWGTVAHPLYDWVEVILNWSFWWLVFTWVGGESLARAMFTMFFFVGVTLIRNINFLIHGYGVDNRRPGEEFNRFDWSYNHLVAKIFIGQWHSNHHLYPRSGRTGFLRGQMDTPWFFFRFLKGIGAVTEIYDNTEDFMRTYYRPYQEAGICPYQGQPQVVT